MAYSEKEKEKLFQKVLNYISNGMALRNVLNRDDTFSKTVWYEMIQNTENNERYARACEERAASIFEDTLNIADNVEQDIIKLPDGREIENKAVIARDRLRVDARKWYLSKLDPKKYGDKLELDNNHSGQIDLAAITGIEIKK